MSNTITNQVKYLKIGNPTAKAVLLALSDFSNDSGECYPSISLLSEYTEFSARAIKTGIDLLELSGVLVVDRTNGRHNKYKIVPSNHVFVDQPLIINKAKPVQLPHQCSTDTSAAAALTSAALPPTSAGGAPVPVQEVHTNHHITINEPSINHQYSDAAKNTDSKVKKFNPKNIKLPANVDLEIWVAFVDMRNQIKKPITERAANNLLAKLEDFGAMANASIDQSIEKCYSSVFPVAQQSPAKQQTQIPRFGQSVPQFGNSTNNQPIDVTPPKKPNDYMEIHHVQ